MVPKQSPHLNFHILLFFITEKSQKFWVFKNVGSASARLIFDPGYGPGCITVHRHQIGATHVAMTVMTFYCVAR